MYNQTIQKEGRSVSEHRSYSQPTKQHRYGYQRRYPRFSSIRLSHTNIEKIKARATKYNQTIGDLVTIIFGQPEYYERLGHETPREGSFRIGK